MRLQAHDSKHRGQHTLPSVFVAGLLFFSVMLVWLTALVGPFQFDDHNVITNYAPVHTLAAWWHSLPGIRPLLKLSYALNWALSPSPFGFHLFNLALHLGNGLLLLLWARRVLPLSSSAALWLTALWLLHPVQTEAVTYISGRSVSFSTTFLLAGLLVLAQQPRHAAWWAAACTLLGLAVRETAWIFPLLFALVEFLRGKNWRETLLAVLPSLFVVVLAALIFLCEPHYRYLIDTSFAARDGSAQLRAQLVGHAYFLHQVFTLNPVIDPDLRTPAQWRGGLLLQAVLWILLLSAALFFTLRQRSWLAAGLLWFFLLLLPTNSFMPRLDIANDRHLYPALIGPLWTLLLCLPRHRLVTAALCLLALSWAAAVLVRNEDYRSEMALWARTAEQSPQKARVWNNLGMACQQAGETDCARTAFQRAIQLDPDNTRPAVNLYFLEKEAERPRARGRP